MNKFTSEDFERMFKYDKGKLPAFICSELSKIDSAYHYADVQEQQEYILQFQALIDEGKITRTKAENLEAFEKGWAENYKKILKRGVSFENLKPGYYRGNKFLRYNNKLIVSENLQIEYGLFKIARYCIFDKYLTGYENICELGSGSGQNLFMLAKYFKNINIVGTDWTNASKKIANLVGKSLDSNIKGAQYDMLESNSSFQIPNNFAVLSIHAFEQLGDNFEHVLNKILTSNPKIVVQYEPVMDYYKKDNLLDALALKYCKKRNYLKGYLDELKKLESEKKIEIIDTYRPYLGGALHESSLIVWRPKH